MTVNVRRAVGEAIVAAQAVRCQRYMWYCICSFSHGKFHPNFSYLRTRLWTSFINIPFFTFYVSLEIRFSSLNPNGIILNITRMSLIQLKIWWDNRNESTLLGLAKYIHVYYNRFRDLIVETRNLRERQDREARASVSWSTTAVLIVEK